MKRRNRRRKVFVSFAHFGKVDGIGNAYIYTNKQRFTQKDLENIEAYLEKENNFRAIVKNYKFM